MVRAGQDLVELSKATIMGPKDHPCQPQVKGCFDYPYSELAGVTYGFCFLIRTTCIRTT